MVFKQRMNGNKEENFKSAMSTLCPLNANWEVKRLTPKLI